MSMPAQNTAPSPVTPRSPASAAIRARRPRRGQQRGVERVGLLGPVDRHQRDVRVLGRPLESDRHQ
jgi:hypothetical protein